VVEESEDSPRSQPTVRQIPQRGQKRVQPIPVLGRGHPMVPGVGLLPEHQTGVGGDRARRCEGRTTPTPSLRCWSSWCRGSSRPCADPARRATCRRRAPRGGSSTLKSAA
jgi:hypothetical protein